MRDLDVDLADPVFIFNLPDYHPEVFEIDSPVVALSLVGTPVLSHAVVPVDDMEEIRRIRAALQEATE